MKGRFVTRVAPILFFFLAALPWPGQAQTRIAYAQAPLEHVITVSRSGTAFAKPDLGILIMALRSSAPTAGDAASASAQKAAAVKSALASLGVSPDHYKLSPVVLGSAGNPYVRPYPSSANGIEASQFVYIFFSGPELADLAQLTGSAAATIEALRKAGAVPTAIPGDYRAPGQNQTAMVIYTVENSDRWENQALQQAVQRTRSAAQAIARQMRVRITGVRSITASYLSGRYIPNSNLAELGGLPYSFFSTRSDEVEIRAEATVYYNFK